MGTTQELPVKTKSLNKKTIEQKVFLIRNDNGQYLLEKRKEKLLNGMWQFPMREQTNANDVISDDLGKSIETINEPVFKLKHQFTHLTWEIKVYNVTAPLNIKENDLPKQMTWFNLDDREQYIFPVPMDKIYKFIEG